MALRSFGFSVAFLLGGFVPCRAQLPSGPATLEKLLNEDGSASAEQTAVDADQPAADSDRPAGRPQGTLVRPRDGVQHPDLDRAWAEYNAAIVKVNDSIKAAITKHFDAATAKGDLDSAERWQVIEEAFEKAGKLPADNETKAAMSEAVADYSKASEQITKAYELLVKTLTIEKKISEAKAVRNELISVLASKKVDSTGSAATARNEIKARGKNQRTPSMSGAWLLSNGAAYDITQSGNTIRWTGQDSGFRYSTTCEWDGEQFIGVCQRTSKSNGCMTRMRIVLTMLSSTHIKQEQTALDTNCDLPLTYREVFEARKR